MLITSTGVTYAGRLNSEDYSLARDWYDGKEDPRLEKFSEKNKKKKIAKSLGVTVSRLEEATRRYEAAIGALKDGTEKAIRTNLSKTPIAERILSVELNTETRQAVAFVQWTCGDKRDVDQEASYVAWAVSKAAQVAEILGLWCVDKAKTKQFSAQIGRTGFTRIDKERIGRFASTRYARLFEQVKRGPHQ